MTTHHHHFGSAHPVASAARYICRTVHKVGGNARLGGVACAGCWESAIRADARCALLFELPATVAPDPDYVDVVAVERALSGQPVRLTDAELLEALRAVAGWRRLAVGALARRLSVSVDRVAGAVAYLKQQKTAAGVSQRQEQAA